MGDPRDLFNVDVCQVTVLLCPLSDSAPPRLLTIHDEFYSFDFVFAIIVLIISLLIRPASSKRGAKYR